MAKKLNWVVKQNTSNVDVNISVSQSGTRISFRNGCFEKINKEGIYFRYAIDGNRMYFDKANEEEGYKIRVESNSTRWVCLTKWMKGFQGGYDLEYDEEEKLYYIEIKESKNVR